MKTAIAMMFDGNVPFGPEVAEMNRAYSDYLGYTFLCYSHFPDPHLDVYWNRIRLMQQELAHYDTIWWVDADAFFLKNEPLPTFLTDFAMSVDWNGICCGVMAVRSTAWASKFLEAWALMGNVRGDRIKDFDNGQFREQTTLKALRYFWPLIEYHFTEIKDCVIQNPTAPFCPSALMLHAWSQYLGVDRVQKTIERFKANGYREDTLERR